ncbi:MAG: hypothetical protein C0467_02820 [Planctomycetaceae bacterium]|nr:hypothetical protein [Planctomycetaceae bacterium]
MKRTWKVWIAAIFGLGISHPVVIAAEPVATPTTEAVSAPTNAPPAELPPTATGAASGGAAPVVSVPSGTEYLQTATKQRFSFLSPRSRSSCQPVAPCAPGQVAPYPYPAPNLDPNGNQQAPAPANTTFQANQGGTAAAHTNSPNMFGDLFGAKASIVTLPGLSFRTMPGALNGRSAFLTANPTSIPPITPPGGVVTVNTPSLAHVTFQGVPGMIPVTLNGSPIVENVTNLGFIPGSPNGARIQADMNGFFLPGTPAFAAANAIERQANPQATLTSLTFGPVSALFNGSQLVYFTRVTDTVTTAVRTRTQFSVPTPGAGGVVGLLKVSEDNSPFPRDRVIFTYDYFNNVPMGLGSLPVNRYQFGFEKTFFEGRTSIEFRAPFASTLSSNSALNGETLGTEFGNVRLLGKALFLQRRNLSISGGLGVSLPTADDISVGDGAGNELVHIKNRSVQLAPFVAAIYTPNDRLFAQGWYGFSFDTGGNPVTVNPALFGTGPDIGKLNSPSLMTVDAQIGYWIYQSESGRLRGLAPFIELHYAGDVSKGTLLSAGNDFYIGDVSAYNEFNMTAGFTSRIGQNTTLAVAAAAPLLGQSGRTFDYQVGVRLNWYFGHTARQRANLAPNSF